MLCIKDYLKRLAARLTTANGDVSAVPGESICDVLDFMVKNLNVDSTGALIVSNLLINLLKRNMVIQLNDEKLGELTLSELLGLELNSTYLLKGYYTKADGERVIINEQANSYDDGGTIRVDFDSGVYVYDDPSNTPPDVSFIGASFDSLNDERQTAVEVVLEGLYKIA